MSQLFNKIPQLFFAPNTVVGPTTGVPSVGGRSAGQPAVNQPTNKEDVIEFLASDDEVPEVLEITPPKKKDEDKEKDKEEIEEGVEPEEKEDEDEEDELAEIEQELEGPTEDQLEFVTPVRRKEILAKYPQLFKDFPYLEKAYYREQQFTEVLGTIDDAKIAVDKAQTLDRFENEIMGGATENILKAVKEENPDGFLKIVDDYLPTLARVDERAYMHVLGNITKHTIVAMVKEAKASNNDALQNAAALLNQFVFGTTNFTPAQNLSRGENPQQRQQEEQVNKREQEFMQRQFENVNTDIGTRVNNTLKNTIEQHIDPKKSMTDYVRRNATKDAIETLQGLIDKDPRFRALTDRLWESAFKDNFSKVSTDRIRSAFLSKAKTLLPSVIKKARNEALRGTGHRVRDNDEVETTPNKGPVPAGKPRSQNPGKIRDAKDIPKGMRTLDFLNSD
jgi:hypothetical protein